MEMTNNSRKVIFLIMAVIFLFYLYMAFNVAFTQDDWTWGSSVGLHRLYNWFAHYNGRYLGNLLEILITRSFTARVLFMSVFSTGVIYLLWRLLDIKYVHNGIVIFFLILSLPANIFAQTYGWGAGFSNYVAAAFFSLLYLNIIQAVIESDTPVYPRWSWLWMIPLGIASELFIEHVTLYNFAVSVAVIVYMLVRYQKIYVLHTVYFLSVLTGAVIMFSNAAYREMLQGTYGVGRSFAFTAPHMSIVTRMIHAAAHIYPYYIFNNTVLILSLSFVGIFLLRNEEHKGLSWFLSLIFGSYAVYKILWIGTFHVRLNELRVLEGLFSLVYVFAILVVICLTVKERIPRIRSIFFLVSSAVLAAPFLVVTPLTPRCFLSSYLMLALLVVELMNVAIKPPMWHVVLRGVGVCVVAIMVMYVGVLTRIGQRTHLRNQEIHKQLKEESNVITVSTYRYTQFMQNSAPKKGIWPYKTFKLYYHIPKSVTVKFNKPE